VFLAGQFARHRLRSTPASDKLIAMAEADPAVIDTFVRQFGGDEPPPASAVPLLMRAAADTSRSAAIRCEAALALARGDSVEGIAAAIDTVAAMWDVPPPDRIMIEKARHVVLWSPKLEKHIGYLSERAERMDGRGSLLADGCLCRLTGRVPASAENRKQAAELLRTGLASGEKRARQIMEAMRLTDEKALAADLLRFLDAAAASPKDATAAELAKAADGTLRHLKLDAAKVRSESQAVRVPLKGTGARSGDRAGGGTEG
jgi:hypothetical protein